MGKHEPADSARTTVSRAHKTRLSGRRDTSAKNTIRTRREATAALRPSSPPPRCCRHHHLRAAICHDPKFRIRITTTATRDTDRKRSKTASQTSHRETSPPCTTGRHHLRVAAVNTIFSPRRGYRLMTLSGTASVVVHFSASLSTNVSPHNNPQTALV